MTTQATSQLQSVFFLIFFFRARTCITEWAILIFSRLVSLRFKALKKAAESYGHCEFCLNGVWSRCWFFKFMKFGKYTVYKHPGILTSIFLLHSLINKVYWHDKRFNVCVESKRIYFLVIYFEGQLFQSTEISLLSSYDFF